MIKILRFLAVSLASSPKEMKRIELEAPVTTVQAETRPLFDGRLSQRQAGFGGDPKKFISKFFDLNLEITPVSSQTQRSPHTEGTGFRNPTTI